MAHKKKNKYSLAIVVSDFNKEVTDGLLKGAMDLLASENITGSLVSVVRCPGAFEIPLTAKQLCRLKKYDAVICLGAVIKGETAHFEYISSVVSSGIAQLNLKYNIPITFGVLTCYTDEQAIARSSDNEFNKGREAAKAAIEMIKLLKEI